MTDSRLTIIEPTRSFRIGWRELWEYRDLFWILLTRDIRVRYKQTVFGAGWAILQPVLLMVVFTVFLGRLAKVPSGGVPYALFAYVGLVPWTFFAQGLAAAASSLVDNERLVTKVYFPRLLMPAAAAASYLLDFVVANLLIVGLVLQYSAGFRWTMILAPIIGVAILLAIIAFGVGLAALNVRYRDVRYAIPFLIQVLLFVTPVVYPATLVTGGWRYVYAANPMAGVVDIYRWAVLGTTHLPAASLLISAASGLTLMVAGVAYFRTVERSFADVI